MHREADGLAIDETSRLATRAGRRMEGEVAGGERKNRGETLLWAIGGKFAWAAAPERDQGTSYSGLGH